MWKLKAKEEVVLKRTEKVGNVTLAITPCLVNPLTHCYCWTVLDERKRTDETGRIQSGCAGCREIRSSKSSRVAKDTPVPMWVAIRDDKISWEGTGNGAAHFCSGPKERSEVEGNQLRRSVIAEIATGSVEKPCSAVAKLERKILDKAGNDQGVVIHRKLHYQEQAQCCGIRIGRVIPNEPNPLYSEISERLQDLQANLTQFLDDGSTEEQYAEVMSNQKKGKNASQEEVEIVNEDESLQVDIPKLEPFVSDKDDEDKLKSFREPNKVREDESITLYLPIKKFRLNCEPNNPESS
uniref:Uncharacterized protein n=1 Tax=Ditylenchus dipsaci TaxID=166011 RepID=A0A915D0W5_9BILA